MVFWVWGYRGRDLCPLLLVGLALSGQPVSGDGLTLPCGPSLPPLAGGHCGPGWGERPFPGPAWGPSPWRAAVSLQQTSGLERGPRVAGGERLHRASPGVLQGWTGVRGVMGFVVLRIVSRKLGMCSPEFKVERSLSFLVQGGPRRSWHGGDSGWCSLRAGGGPHLWNLKAGGLRDWWSHEGV